MEMIYPEISFTPEWKEGRRFEKDRIIKIIKAHCESIINEINEIYPLDDTNCVLDESGDKK